MIPPTCVVKTVEFPDVLRELKINNIKDWLNSKRRIGCSAMGGYSGMFTMLNTVMVNTTAEEKEDIFLRELSINWERYLS